MNKRTILAVEDDPAIRNLIATTLEANDYPHFLAETGKMALTILTANHPDILLLDLGLPDMDGIEIIKKARTFTLLPIIIISARSEESDKVEALDAGADDYLTKPFSVEELLARIRATERRLNAVTVGDVNVSFINGDLHIDFLTGSVSVKDEELRLTPIEYKLLCLLAHNVGKVLTHRYITNEIWGSSWENDVASLRVFMTTLRKKLGKSGEDQPYIQTHVGVGYRMVRV